MDRAPTWSKVKFSFLEKIVPPKVGQVVRSFREVGLGG